MSHMNTITVEEKAGSAASAFQIPSQYLPAFGRSPINIIIAGESGLGKSTLINAFFGIDIAKTGVGEPVTDVNTSYKHPNNLVCIIDTKGFVRESKNNVSGEEFDGAQLVEFIKSQQEKPTPLIVDIVWYFIEDRVHPEDWETWKNLAAINKPCVIIIAKADTKEELKVEQMVFTLNAKIKSTLPNSENFSIVPMRNPRHQKSGPRCPSCKSDTVKQGFGATAKRKLAWTCLNETCDYYQFPIQLIDSKPLIESLEVLRETVENALPHLEVDFDVLN
ncbi:hypothetical protein HK096_007238 [Nowakowskiella sp. JEL0078]|nr:hypothetical protein HK096_007238 [Nowakowskiella sp. JEL0078]